MSEMSEMTDRIMLVVLAGLLIVGFIWFRNNEPAPVGLCVQLAGTNNEIPVYYRLGDSSFATFSYPDCSSESRITI
jgi:hypothetical protein